MKQDIKKIEKITLVILALVVSLMVFNFLVSYVYLTKIDNNLSNVENQLIDLELIDEN